MIAKNVYGCTVIGSAGGPAKCRKVVAEFGFDHCIDYKTCNTAGDLIRAIRKASPDGIDMYFENVGGMHFTAACACRADRPSTKFSYSVCFASTT